MDEATLEKPQDAGEKSNEQVKFWLGELELAGKREEAWVEEAKDVVEIYEAEKSRTHQFNILYSNTETLLPAIYNNVPRPAVRRRYHQKDPVGLQATKIANRLIEYYFDTNLEGFGGGFHETMCQVVLEALLVGRGVPWLKFENGTISMDCVPWDFYRQSYAKRQRDVWWIARRWDMTRRELEANFGKLGGKVKLPAHEDSEVAERDDSDNRGSLRTACVWEIWDKIEGKVYFITEGYKQGFLREIEDPLKLSGFFPVPRLLLWMRKVGKTVPVTPYSLYRQQAEELNAITLRIQKLIRIMKWRGGYDASAEGLDAIFELDDGKLAPIQNVAALQQGQGKLDNALWLVPIEKLVTVLQQLYTQREQVKAVIFEITGLADIIRGASKASETLGAQQIKERWGGLRIRRMQAEVQLLVRAVMRSTLELCATHTPTADLKKLTNSELPLEAEKAAIVQALNMAQATGQQPPQELIELSQQPSFDSIAALLKDNITRSFRIDIETNSTVDVEATDDQKMMMEFMTGVGQFINGISPLIQTGVLPFEVAQEVLLSMTRRLRFGPEVEDGLKKMQAPKPQDDGKAEAQAKAKADRDKLVAETAGRQQELVLRQKEVDLEQQRVILEKERVLLEREQATLAREETALNALKVQHEMGLAEKKFELENRKLDADIENRREDRAVKVAEAAANRASRFEQGAQNASV